MRTFLFLAIAALAASCVTRPELRPFKDARKEGYVRVTANAYSDWTETANDSCRSDGTVICGVRLEPISGDANVTVRPIVPLNGSALEEAEERYVWASMYATKAEVPRVMRYELLHGPPVFGATVRWYNNSLSPIETVCVFRPLESPVNMTIETCGSWLAADRDRYWNHFIAIERNARLSR
jgi:hypothetical protein